MPGGVELLRFARSLSAASSLVHLEHSFLTGFASVVGARFYGYDLVDRTTRTLRIAHAGVSDTFVARYQRDVRDIDPMRARVYEAGETAYNRDLMSGEEWEASPAYRSAYSVHGIRHVAEVPVRVAGRIGGNLHLADNERDLGRGDLAIADAVADVIGSAVERIEAHEQVERERDQAVAALEATGASVAIADPRSTDVRLNAAAQRLLDDVAESEERLHALLARPAEGGAFARRVDVELATGERATLHGHASPLPRDGGGIVVVLELEREQIQLSPTLLGALTTREREVAVLVVDGLADREIAERLCLSHHTVSQYVKRIYRRLDVDSRVALTRALLGRR
ncbi:MAG TPA: LuxR C-terminal-related transcriptional regulator [Solirubrobacteraceae bacterium]|nr:LuxR C-terminal-related transcriptional regulator [Solirubrobacteraceae bacterium]